MANFPKKSQEGRLIGALLRVPYLTVVDHTYHGLRAAGFDDLTHAHLTVFQHIDEKKGSRLIDLSEAAQITKQSMGYLVDHLEARGYLERMPDDSDGRARLIRLTARGEALFQTALTLVRDVERQWAEIIGQEKLHQLKDILKELVSELED